MCMAINFINEKKYNWKVERIDSMYAAYIGRHQSINKLLMYFKQKDSPKISEIQEITNSMTGNFAIVVETDDWIFGLVDRIAGFQIFYRNTPTGCILSNSPRRLLSEGQERFTSDLSSITELKMAGYLTNNKTMDKNIFYLCAGEMLLCNKKSHRYKINNYFKFYSPRVREKSDALLIKELDDVTNLIIQRNIKDSHGKTIWVPLSGGLDSRLIVCKLKQLGCDNFRTYSYGVPGNFDALRAKKIASILGVQWEFISTTPLEAREYFLSQDRKEYWTFSDCMSVVPNLHGMFALKKLIESGQMKPGDVVINGQSGDFVTGQHIPILKKSSANNEVLINNILKKHYSLREDMCEEEMSIELMRDKIKESLGEHQNVTSYQELAKSYEYWEWKERQTKRVVNGQHNYDYFKLNWELPLWDLEYLEFWVDLPLHQKIDRRLFVKYLNEMNFYNLFNGTDKFMSRWPINRVYIQFFGNILSKIFGKKISNLYYKRLDWYSQYQYIYALTEKDEYNRHWRYYRGPYPYMINTWISENLKK